MINVSDNDGVTSQAQKWRVHTNSLQTVQTSCLIYAEHAH